MELSKTAYTLIICIASVFILVYLESILIPFVFAFIIWFLIKEFRNISNKITFVNRYFPNWLLNLVAFVIIFGLITVFSKILSSNITQLMNELPKYQANISKLIKQGNAVLGMDILNEMYLAIESYDFTSILKQLFNSLSGILGNIFLVTLYVLFLLLEEEYLPSKLRGIFPINEQFNYRNFELYSTCSYWCGLSNLLGDTNFFVKFYSYCRFFICNDFPCSNRIIPVWRDRPIDTCSELHWISSANSRKFY